MKKIEAVRGWIRGVDNVSSPDMVEEGYLVECNNVHLDQHGTAFSRKGYSVDTLLPLGWYTKDACTSTTGWAVSTDGDNLTTDTDNYVTGYSSLEFDKTGTTEEFIYADKTFSNADWGEYGEVYLFTYIPDGSNITSVTILVYSNTSNYYYSSTDVTEGGWNKCSLAFATADTAGSPSNAIISKVRVKYNCSDATDTATDIFIDAIIAVNRSRIDLLTDFITTDGDEYHLAVADGNIWKQTDTTLNGKHLWVGIYSGFGSGGLCSAATFNDKIYFVCEGAAGVKFDGASVSLIGVDAPNAPGFNSYGSGSLSGDYYYVCTAYNPDTGHESAPSVQSDLIEADGTQSIVVNMPDAPSDASYTQFRLYRRSVYAGGNVGAVNYYKVATVDVGTGTYEDDTATEDLAAANILNSVYNDPIQSGFVALAILKDRLLACGIDGNFWYSGNLKPEAWSPYNGLAVITEAVNASNKPIAFSPPIGTNNSILIFTRNTTHLITYYGASDGSDGSSTTHPYRISPVSNFVGCVSQASIVSTPMGIIWCAIDGVYLYDGSEISKLSAYQGDNENTLVGWFDNINAEYAHTTVACLNNDYYRVSIPEGDAGTPTRTFELNINTGAWTSHDLALEASYVKIDKDGSRSWYHSAENGEVTYEDGYSDNGSSYECCIKTKAYYYGTSISPRRVDLITNGGSNSFVFKQFHDLSNSSYTFLDGNNHLIYIDSSPVTRIDTWGTAKFVQFEFCFTPEEQMSINGFNHHYEVRYND